MNSLSTPAISNNGSSCICRLSAGVSLLTDLACDGDSRGPGSPYHISHGKEDMQWGLGRRGQAEVRRVTIWS